jgi:hypothetical protein
MSANLEAEMNLQLLPTTTTAEAEETLEDLAEELEIPPYRYEQAEASYKSLGRWLNRENSRIRQYGPQVHVQGSFGLGTVIPPITDDEHYDVDPVTSLPPDQGSGQPDPANAALTHGGIDLRPRKCRGGPALLRNATITIAARGSRLAAGLEEAPSGVARLLGVLQHA